MIDIAALDWIFASVLLLSLIVGAWRGFVFEVLSLLGWVAAFVLARWFAADVAQRLPMGETSEWVRYGAGFVVVFIATVMLTGLLAILVKKLLASVGLRPVDRILGAIFGLVRGALLLLLSTVLAAMTPLKSSPIWLESVGVQLTFSVFKSIKQVLPSDLDKFLPVE